MPSPFPETGARIITEMKVANTNTVIRLKVVKVKRLKSLSD